MKTIKELTIKLLGNENGELTPEEARELLNEKYEAEDRLDSNDWDSFVFCGEKSMYVFNHLFGEGAELTNEEVNKYQLLKENAVIEYLYDGDADFAWSEDIDLFKEENIPYIACLAKPFVDMKSFLNTISLICKATEDWIKVECFTSGTCGNYKKSGFEIDKNGDIAFYGPTFEMDCDSKESLAGSLYHFILSFNCKSFENMESLCVPIALASCDSDDEFEQFFEAAGFNK